MDEAQIRAEIRAEVEAEVRAEIEASERKAQLDAALNRQATAANREKQWEHGRVNAQPGDAARIIGAALTDQMVAGMPGTQMNEDGYGYGRA